MSDKKVTLFGNKTLGPYKLSDIFDPDIHEASPEISGKIVPAVSSLVLDDINGKRNKLYLVTSVNQETFKAIMAPVSMVTGIDGEERVVSYGNDVYMLYYIPDTKKLIIDNKLTFFGNQGVKYQIVKTEPNGTITVISKYDENHNAVDTINLNIYGNETHVKKCPPCYTNANLSQGGIVQLRILDDTGDVVAQIHLVIKNASGILESTKNPVIDLLVEPNQEEDGDIVILTGQNPGSLRFNIKVKYDDNSTEEVIHQKTISEIQQNGSVYVYGADQIESRMPNSTYTLLFKKYLPSYDYTTNHVSCAKRVKVITPEVLYGISKVSVIPTWNASDKKWVLKYLAYYYDRTTNPNYISVNVDNYDGTLFDVEQVLTINTTHQNPYNENEDYQQKFSIKFGTPNKLTFDGREYNFTGGIDNTRRWVNISQGTTRTILFDGVWKQITGSDTTYSAINSKNNPWDVAWSGNAVCTVDSFIKQRPIGINWLISDYPNTSAIYYGNDKESFDRPRIHYGSMSGVSGSVYHIPIQTFGSPVDGVGKFLNEFYNNANPPKNPFEVFPTVPTHFRIRNIDTLNIIQSGSNSIKPIADWSTQLYFPANATYNGITVIVEFLVLEGGTYKMLYGVPVEIISN